MTPPPLRPHHHNNCGGGVVRSKEYLIPASFLGLHTKAKAADEEERGGRRVVFIDRGIRGFKHLKH